MCITSVTISRKAISGGVECASSSRKSGEIWLGEAGGRGGLPVNPEEQLLLRQTRLLLPFPRQTKHLPDSRFASELKKPDYLFRVSGAAIRTRVPAAEQICSVFIAA